MTQQKAFQYPASDGATPLESVESYEFQPNPIRGYPELHWQGKRPFTSTHYYPAQRKEVHGPAVEGWRNKLYWGDNLQVMSHLLKEFRGQVQLVYIDPPFDSKAEYKKRIQLRGQGITNDHSTFEEKQYTDIWTNDEYLQFMYERFLLIRELLSESGSVWLHCDWHRNYHLRSILDEIFGTSFFLNELIWQRTFSRAASKTINNIHDTILIYAKGSNALWNEVKTEPSEEYIDKRFTMQDSDGRKFQGIVLTAPSISKGETGQEWRGFNPTSQGRHWAYKLGTLEELDADSKIYWPESGGWPRLKRYADEVEGVALQSIWTDISPVNSQAYEATGFPTQKPEELLDRIIQIASNPGDLVFDCFCGSGTTQAVAMRLGRRFLGADINLGAIQITTKRLLTLLQELQEARSKMQEAGNKMEQATLDLPLPPSASSPDPIYRLPSTVYPGFEVYNVNHYDIFRNPVEARDLLLQALEVQRLPAGSLFDGEKDGRMVKLMPVNRIATRADLNDLIAGFDYRGFEQRRSADPTKPVERVMLVCMGHEPDLAAALQQETQPYTLDVDVVDILRDRADLHFKRDAEADVRVEDGHLVIRRFYPMNLLQKLSLQKEKVGEWRELVESVMIDWNYDGAILEPHLVDIPEKNDLVTGRYPIPEDAGTIRVKITDLLSESLEVEVAYG